MTNITATRFFPSFSSMNRPFLLFSFGFRLLVWAQGFLAHIRCSWLTGIPFPYVYPILSWLLAHTAMPSSRSRKNKPSWVPQLYSSLVLCLLMPFTKTFVRLWLVVHLLSAKGLSGLITDLDIWLTDYLSRKRAASASPTPSVIPDSERYVFDCCTANFVYFLICCLFI